MCCGPRLAGDDLGALAVEQRQGLKDGIVAGEITLIAMGEQVAEERRMAQGRRVDVTVQPFARDLANQVVQAEARGRAVVAGGQQQRASSASRPSQALSSSTSQT